MAQNTARLVQLLVYQDQSLEDDRAFDQVLGVIEVIEVLKGELFQEIQGLMGFKQETMGALTQSCHRERQWQKGDHIIAPLHQSRSSADHRYLE